MSDDYSVHVVHVQQDEIRTLRDMLAGSLRKTDLQAARIFTLMTTNTLLSDRVAELERMLDQAQSVAIGRVAGIGDGPKYARIRDAVWNGDDAA